MLTGFLLSLVPVFYQTCLPNEHRGGWYELEAKRIFICRQYEENDTVLLHEFSHWIFFEKLTRVEKEQRYKLSKGTYVTMYASTLPEEDRAEEGRAYFQGLKYKNSKKRSFIKRIMLKNGFTPIKP